MKIIVLLLFFSAQCTAQTITTTQAKKLSDEIIKCIKQNSIYATWLDYDDIQKDFEQYIDTFTTYEKVGRYYTLILRMTGDNHSFYANKKMLDNYSKKQKENIGFSYKLLEGNIGYLNIPDFLSVDKTVINDFANQIHNAIRELDTQQTIAGWIVDLRHNTGGNMWPMVLGLNPLIGNETAGYFKYTNKKGLEKWTTTSSTAGITIKDPYKLKTPENKIAVLYSNKTASSGEATAICFIGKSNTRSFGTPTAGFTTGNHIFYLSDDNIFVLAVSYDLDRNKKEYKGALIPDVLMQNSTDESVLPKAIEWLKE
jgi:carboxyl-terminal processing protease